MQVGPDCTCVKSRMRTPSSALPAWPNGLLDGLGCPLPFFLATSFTTFFDFAAAFFAAFFASFLAGFAAFFCFLAICCLPVFPSAHSRASGNPANDALGPRFRGDERMCHFFFSLLCGLRLPMRPLSLPAAGSSTALISVGLPLSIAALTARLSSSGDVALTPTPPKASIILS